MFERTDPKTLKMWLLLAAIVYFVLPFDLIPDLLGILGRIDDIAMIALLAWFYRNHLKQFVAAAAGFYSSWCWYFHFTRLLLTNSLGLFRVCLLQRPRLRLIM